MVLTFLFNYLKNILIYSFDSMIFRYCCFVSRSKGCILWVTIHFHMNRPLFLSISTAKSWHKQMLNNSFSKQKVLQIAETMLTDQKVRNVLKKGRKDGQFLGKLISLTDCSIGVDQEVKVATTQPNNKYVIKYPRTEPQKVMHEVIGCERSHEQGVPVPKIYHYDQELLIQQYIQGQMLQKVETSPKQFSNMYRSLGRYLKQIHQNKASGFGKIAFLGKTKPKKLQGIFKNGQQTVKDVLQELRSLEERQHYSQQFLLRIKKYLDAKLDLLRNYKGPCTLIHGDYSESNIIATQKEIRAIIDFGDLAVGCPMEDFARMFVSHYGTYKFNSLIEGYGAHDMELIKLYAVALSLWQMNGCLQKGKVRGRLRKLEKSVQTILREAQSTI